MLLLLLSVSTTPSLLQETVVGRPPVEVQVRVNTGGSVVRSVFNWKVMSPGIVTCPVGGKDQQQPKMHNYIVKLNSIVLNRDC